MKIEREQAMNRPYIFCHMLTSLDGKIMGNYMDTPKAETAGDFFYQVAFGDKSYYKHQGWISGRVTTDDNFTFYKEPDLRKEEALVPTGDFVAQPTAEMYYISVDASGKLGWKDATLQYMETKAHVIEVLTEKASNAYKAFLRRLGISYIIAGKNELDYTMMLEKLSALFPIKTLMLGGGGVLNWSFVQQGLCDELSIVMAAAADGSDKTASLFSVKEGMSQDIPVSFTLQEVQKLQDSGLWLRYSVDNAYE